MHAWVVGAGLVAAFLGASTAASPARTAHEAASPSASASAEVPFRIAPGIAGRRLALLVVYDVPRGASIRVRCLDGCRKRWTRRVTSRRRAMRVRIAKRARIRVGSRIEIDAYTNAGGVYREVLVLSSGLRSRGQGCVTASARRIDCVGPATPVIPQPVGDAPAVEGTPTGSPTPSGTASPTPSTTPVPTPTPDATKPSTPTGLSTSGATQTSVSLSWTASTDNVKVTGYDVYRNGAKVASTTSTSYGFGGLACSTTYTLGVIAYDAAGNRSAQATANGATQGCPPPPPSISLSKGGSAPSGFWYSVVLNNFAPGSSVTVTCRDSVDPGGFYSQAFGINSGGQASDSTLCYSGDGPDHWVTAPGVESNHVGW